MRARLLVASMMLAGCDPGAHDELARVEQATVELGRADSVFGQPNLTTGSEPPIVSSETTHFPAAIASDIGTPTTVSSIWVADRNAHRVLVFEPSSSFATMLMGQTSFFGREPNGGGEVSATTLHTPSGLSFARNRLAIADTANNRVLLLFWGGGFSPQNVFGQLDAFNTAEPNKGGSVSANTLLRPEGVAFDAATDPGRLIVADTGNHRVLIYSLNSPISTTAKQCLGQPDCTFGGANRGAAVSRDSFNEPRGVATYNVATDPLRGFYVVDTGNHRVLHYLAFATTPARVYGQHDDFTTAIPSKGGPSARSLRFPTGVAVDRDGSLWIADTGHHRVLHFPRGVTIADRVLGQPNMTTVAPPKSASATTLKAPEGVAVAPTEVLVADTGFSRVVRFWRPCDAPLCDDGDKCTDDVCSSAGCFHNAVTFPTACRGHRCLKNVCQPCSATMGCRSGYQCLDGKCVLRCANDAQCMFGGACVEGYCCDRACDGPCESCAQRGYFGECKPIAGAPIPPKTCGAVSDCGGRCDGRDGSRCHDADVGATCGAEMCVDGVAHRRGSCAADGSCSGEKRVCAPYACGVDDCLETCRFDYECAKGASCVAGTCSPGDGVSPGGGCSIGTDNVGTFALAAFALGALGVARRRR